MYIIVQTVYICNTLQLVFFSLSFDEILSSHLNLVWKADFSCPFVPLRRSVQLVIALTWSQSRAGTMVPTAVDVSSLLGRLFCVHLDMLWVCAFVPPTPRRTTVNQSIEVINAKKRQKYTSLEISLDFYWFSSSTISSASAVDERAMDRSEERYCVRLPATLLGCSMKCRYGIGCCCCQTASVMSHKLNLFGSPCSRVAGLLEYPVGFGMVEAKLFVIILSPISRLLSLQIITSAKIV